MLKSQKRAKRAKRAKRFCRVPVLSFLAPKEPRTASLIDKMFYQSGNLKTVNHFFFFFFNFCKKWKPKAWKPEPFKSGNTANKNMVYKITLTPFSGINDCIFPLFYLRLFTCLPVDVISSTKVDVR